MVRTHQPQPDPNTPLDPNQPVDPTPLGSDDE